MRFFARHPVLVTIPVILLVWAIASERGWVGRTLLASPLEVGERLIDAARPGSPHHVAIYSHAFETIKLALTGWGTACVLGMLVGFATGSSRLVYAGIEPLFECARAIPPILAFPLLLVAFSFTTSAYTWTIVFGCLPVMALAVARGIQGLDRSRLEILTIHRASRVVRFIAALMEVLPSAFLGARITFSISLVIAVVTEMVFTPRSGLALGSLAKDAEISFDTPTFYACIVTIGTYGYVANILLRRIEHWLKGDAPDLES